MFQRGAMTPQIHADAACWTAQPHLKLARVGVIEVVFHGHISNGSLRRGVDVGERQAEPTAVVGDDLLLGGSGVGAAGLLGIRQQNVIDICSAHGIADVGSELPADPDAAVANPV